MKILITGVNGFIGSNLARHLISLGHQIKGLVRSTSKLTSIKDLPVSLVYGDILDQDSVSIAMSDCELVIHTAGAVTDWGSMEYFYKHNVEGLQNVCRAAQLAGVHRFVHISTLAIYGFKIKNGIENDSIYQGEVRYSITKQQGVSWLKQFAEKSSMEVVIVNPGNVFGPGDEKFILPYLDIIYKNKFIYVDGGKSLTCPTYIDNLVHGITLACFEPKAKDEEFNITDGLEITWKEFTDALYRGLNKKPITSSIPRAWVYKVAQSMERIYSFFNIKNPPLLTRYRIDNASLDYHFSIDKAKRILGYHPPVDFERTITKTVDWYKTYRGLDR